MNTTTHLSDATHFLMSLQNVITFLFAGFAMWHHFSFELSKLTIFLILPYFPAFIYITLSKI